MFLNESIWLIDLKLQILLLNLCYSNCTWLLWKTTPHPTHDGSLTTIQLETNLYSPIYGSNCQVVDQDSVKVDNLYCQKKLWSCKGPVII